MAYDWKADFLKTDTSFTAYDQKNYSNESVMERFSPVDSEEMVSRVGFLSWSD